MKKKKVLQLPITNSGSGVSQYVLGNWDFIDKTRFQFDFATRSKSLDFSGELIEQGCKIHYLSCSSEENEEQFIKEMHQILDEGYDAIHLHTSFWKGFLVEKLAVERKCPIIIVHSHSTMVDVLDEEKREEYIKMHNMYRNSFPMNYATHFCACSTLAADWLFGEQIPREKIQLLSNAIDISKFSYSLEARKSMRETLGLNGCFVMGNVGRFVYQKNHAMLIEIFRNVYMELPNGRLVLVGSGELENELRQQVTGYGLEHAVQFLGKRNDVPELLQAMDMFLLPSRFEGLPIVLIEAQTAGLKCIASETISTEVKITDNLELLPLSVSDWVEKILNIAGGYDRINQDHLIAQAGYDLSNQIKLIEQLYAGKDISS